jgi:cytoskeletal protein CcmA (bactofilin family)
MSRHAYRLAVALLAILVVLGGLPAVAVAQQSAPDGSGDGSSGAIVRIDENETFDGTLDATAGAVVVAGTVDGDVSAAAGSVLVTDSGRVTGDLNATAGSVLVEGRVGGDLTVAAAALELREGSRIGGSVDAGVADARLAGSDDSDTALSAATAAIAPTATIDGSLTYSSEQTTIADGATIEGDVTRDEDLTVAQPNVFGGGGSGPDVPTLPPWVGAVYSGLTSLLLGAILLAAAPNVSRRLAEVGTTDPLRTGGIGLATLLGTPIALVIVAVTIVGLPLSIVGFVVFGAVVWAATVYGAFVLGTWLLSLGDYRNRWAALVVGVVAVALVRQIPSVGGLVRVAVLLLGLGAVATVLYELRGGDDADDDAADAAAVMAE